MSPGMPNEYRASALRLDEIECERCGVPFTSEGFELLCPVCLQAEDGRTWPDRVNDRIIHGIAHFTVAAMIVWICSMLLPSCHLTS
jgi:hypothetical protein